MTLLLLLGTVACGEITPTAAEPPNARRPPTAEERQRLPMLGGEDLVIGRLDADTPLFPESAPVPPGYRKLHLVWETYRLYMACSGGHVLLQESLDLDPGSRTETRNSPRCEDRGPTFSRPSGLLFGSTPEDRPPEPGDEVEVSVVPQRTAPDWVVLIVVPSDASLRAATPADSGSPKTGEPGATDVSAMMYLAAVAPYKSYELDISCAGIRPQDYDLHHLFIEESFVDSNGNWNAAVRPYYCASGFPPDLVVAVEEQWQQEPEHATPIFITVFPLETSEWSVKVVPDAAGAE